MEKKSLKGRKFRFGSGRGPVYHVPEGTIFHVMENDSRTSIATFLKRQLAVEYMIENARKDKSYSIIAEEKENDTLILLGQY